MSMPFPEPTSSVVLSSGEVTIHTFISAEALLANATHVIEGPNEVVVVDGQFIVPVAMGFRAFVDSLGKPINRIYLSHDHPDHFFGVSAAFGDVPIYALPETIAFLKEHGEEIRAARQQDFGPMVPPAIVIPTHEITPGREVIDGVTFDHDVVRNAETETQLTIGLPDLGVFIAQDLIYSGGHLYIEKDVTGWIEVLQQLLDSEWTTFLPGHGAPADKAEVAANIEYLQTASQIYADSPDAETYKAAILARYPVRSGAAIIDIYAPRLYS